LGIAALIAVDTSAIVAIVLGEPERASLRDIIRRSGRALVSTVSLLEARIVIHSRRGQRGVELFDELIQLPMFELVAPGQTEITAAYAAFIAYGKGSGHPAGLNFGDLFAYALAKTRNLPLLFKGTDFTHTDAQSAAALP
jgi:ribonuclease VapC